MALREASLDTQVKERLRPVFPLVAALVEAGIELHMLRDPTRGGLSSALNETARKSNAGILIDEERLPVPSEVQGVCEILGFDPLYVANEGNFVAFAREGQGGRAVEVLRAHPLGAQATLIGRAVAEHPGTVVMKTLVRGERIVDVMSGEQLRILAGREVSCPSVSGPR
jgi:hydrogenase expression/formation protein HypE